MPPLISDYPLSYRSDQPNISARCRFTIRDNKHNPSFKTIYCTDKVDQVYSSYTNNQFGSTASTICGLEVKSCSASGVQSG